MNIGFHNAAVILLRYVNRSGQIANQLFDNVWCIRCNTWGHVKTDKICPFYGKFNSKALLTKMNLY